VHHAGGILWRIPHRVAVRKILCQRERMHGLLGTFDCPGCSYEKHR
jgi:hypothetical protein